MSATFDDDNLLDIYNDAQQKLEALETSFYDSEINSSDYKSKRQDIEEFLVSIYGKIEDSQNLSKTSFESLNSLLDNGLIPYDMYKDHYDRLSIESEDDPSEYMDVFDDDYYDSRYDEYKDYENSGKEDVYY